MWASQPLSLHIPSWIGELAQLWETSSSSPWWGHFNTKRDWMDSRVKWRHKWFSWMFLKHGACCVMLTPILATYLSVVRGQVGVFKFGMLVWYSWSITLDYLSGTRHNVSIKMRHSVLRTRAWCQQSGNIIGECWLSLDLLSNVMSKILNESDSSNIVYLVYLFHF